MQQTIINWPIRPNLEPVGDESSYQPVGNLCAITVHKTLYLAYNNRFQW